MKKKLIEPIKVFKLYCSNEKCKELMVKIYPNSSIRWTNGNQKAYCVRCVNKGLYNNPVS